MMDKYPLTIRLDEELLKAVKAQAAQTRSSLGSVVVDAARQSLMPEYREKQEQVLLRAMDRCFNRLVKLHEDQQSQHELMQEMLATFIRTFFRHTPPVKPEDRVAMRESAAKYFELFLDMLATNRRDGLSVMDLPANQQAHTKAVPIAKPAPKLQIPAHPEDAGNLFGR